MKIITKTIANRIKAILPNIVNEAQNAFLPDRLIIDNVLLAVEAFNYIKKKKHGNNGFVGIKLDISKAYDSLEWDFIESTLTTMGFPTSMVSTIMKCIRSVSFSILINGNPTDQFIPQRHQTRGHSFSLFIHFMC